MPWTTWFLLAVCLVELVYIVVLHGAMEKQEHEYERHIRKMQFDSRPDYR